jgi:hypothetical protein
MMRVIDRGMASSARAKARAGSRRRLDEAVGAFGTDSPPLLGLMACRITHSARFARCVRTDAASQLLKRAARAAMSPAVLGASYARRRLPARSFAAPVVDFHPGTASGPRRDRGHPSGAISGSASSAGPGEARTQCALRRLTHGICSSAAPAGRVASYAVLARAEQHSAVGAQRRPTQHEPLAGAPWRDARERSNAKQQ